MVERRYGSGFFRGLLAIGVCAAAVYVGQGARRERQQVDIKPNRGTYRLIGPGTIYPVSPKKGLGAVSATPARGLAAGEAFTMRIEHTVGEEGLQPGDAFVVIIPYPWSQPTYINGTFAVEKRRPLGDQNAAMAAGFSRAWSSNAKSRLSIFCDRTIDTSRLGEGWHLIVTVHDAALRAGEKLYVAYGDTTHGGPGAVTHLAHEFEVPGLIYRQIRWDEIEKAAKSGGTVRVYEKAREHWQIENSPMVRIGGARAAKYVLVAPATVRTGKDFPLKVVARDRFENVAGSCESGVRFTAPGDVTLPKAAQFARDDECIKNLQARIASPGAFRIAVSSANGSISATSNPVAASKETPEYELYWGDLHTHTVDSDGLGTHSSALRYGRDAAGLDFVAITDHYTGVTEYMRKNAEAFNEPGRYVTFNAFELSGIPEGGGDVILYFKKASVSYENLIPTKTGIFPIGNIDQVSELVAGINRQDVVIVPHNHAGNYEAYRKGFDNESVRLIEIYSVWGNSEMSAPAHRAYHWDTRPRTVQKALALGYKMGIIASGDEHGGRPGYGSWLRLRRVYQNGLVGAYSKSLTREGLWDAIWNRRVYGTTGARIHLDFSLNGYPMGQIVRGVPKGPRKLKVSVIGTAKLEEISIIRNNAVIHRVQPSASEASFEYEDVTPPTATDYYYVRLVQVDSELAWSSPVWLLQP